MFDALAVREVPCHYILPRWSAEKVDDAENVEVAGEPLQATQISNLGRHLSVTIQFAPTLPSS